MNRAILRYERGKSIFHITQDFTRTRRCFANTFRRGSTRLERAFVIILALDVIDGETFGDRERGGEGREVNGSEEGAM